MAYEANIRRPSISSLRGQTIRQTAQLLPAQSLIRREKGRCLIFSRKLITRFLLLAGILSLYIGPSQAAIFYTRQSGNWTSSTTWSTAGCGGTAVGAGIYPQAGDDVFICSGHTVTVDAGSACNSLTFNAPILANGVTISGANTLTVSGAIIMNIPSAAVSSTLAVGGGTLNAASIAIPGSNLAGRNCILSISTGTVNISGNITFSGTAAQARITFTGAGNLNVGGNFGAGGTFTASTSTVTFNGPNASTFAGYTYYNLVIAKNTSPTSVLNNANAFNATNVTVNQGNLTLQATDAHYLISNDLTIGTNGTLTHSVSWPVYGRAIIVSGNIAIDGIFTYTVTSHVQMNSSLSRTVRTGSNAASAFSIFSLINNGNYSASGTVRVNNNFNAGYTGGTTAVFHTNGESVTAGLGFFVYNSSSAFVDGGSLNVSSGTHIGYGTTNGASLTVSAGTWNTDNVDIGNGVLTGNLAQSAGITNITGNLLIYPSCSFTVTNSPVISISGNWTNNGTYTRGTETVTFTGSSGQNLGGTAQTTFHNLTINKSSNDVTLSGSAISTTVAGTLALTSGDIITGGNTLIISSTLPGSISGGSSSSYINGILRRNIAAGTNTYLYPVGTAIAYAPATLAFTAGTTTGYLNGFTTDGDHTNIGSSTFNASRTVNRNWSFNVVSGLGTANYGATFNWVAADQDAGFGYASAIAGKYSASSWAYPAIGTRTPTSIQITGVNGLGAFQVGNECLAPTTPVLSASPGILCAGQSATLTVVSGTLNDATDWYWYDSSCGTGPIGSGLSVNVSPVVTTTYYCRGEGNCTGACGEVTVTVYPIPEPTLSGPTPVCRYSTGNVYTTEAGMSDYVWSVSAGGTVTAGGTSTSNTVTVTWDSPGAQYVSVNYSNAGGCTAPSPVIFDVTVNPIPDVTATPGSQTICSGGTTGIVLSGSVPSTTFSWTVAIAPAGSVTGASAGSGNAINQTLINVTTNPATVTYTVTPTANGCTGQPVNVVVTVNPTPNVTASPASQTICSGGTTSIALAGNVSNTVFSWTIAIAPIGSITGASAGSGSTIAQTLVNTTANPATVTYTVTPTANGCSGTPINVVVTVNPSPSVTATPSSQTMCSGGTTNIVLSSTTPSTTYSWTIAINPAGSITGASAGSGSNISQTLTNITSNPATVTYTVTPTANGCPGSPIQVVVTVNPIPVAIATPASQTICSGQTTGIALSSATPSTTFSWTVSVSPAGSITGASAGSGSAITQTLTNTTASMATATYTVTPSANGCTGSAITVVVTVNPSPSVTLTASPSTICYGETITLTATNSGGTVYTSFSGSSGTINLAIPNNSNGAYSYSTINLNSGGLTLATTDILQVTVNISHTYDADLDIFLVSPLATGAILLSTDNGGSGDHYTNTVLRTNATNPITGGTPPFTGTYLPEGAIGTAPSRTGAAGGGNYNLVIPAGSLNGVAIDGSWSLRVFDDNTNSSGTLVSWSLAIYRPLGGYSCVFNGPPTIGPVTYSGSFNSTATVTVSPPVGNNSYTVTTTDAAGCSVTSSPVSVTVNPLPEAAITPDYCLVEGYIVLYAHPEGCSYLWSTGETTDSILVDEVGIYQVEVTNGYGCSATAYLFVANELVTDGSFINFNPSSPSFFSEYTQNQSYYNPTAPDPTQTGLWPEGYYAVNVSAWYDPATQTGYHPNFHGRDHTNNTIGSRNFLMVNGSTTLIPDPPGPDRQRIIWQQTVAVEPNTNYYFSAWGMNLNPVSPARLQFEVNGQLVGSIADLNAAPKPTSEAEVSLTNWVRFYSTPYWNSGSATTAVIRIRNLNTDPGGNDFGLDDISFGTLDPPRLYLDVEANGGEALCEGDTLFLESNATGGVPPFEYEWAGPDGFSSGQANPIIPGATFANEGWYYLMVTDESGCATAVTDSTYLDILDSPTCVITGADTVCPKTAGMIYSGPFGMTTYAWTSTGNCQVTGPTNESTLTVTSGPLCDSTFTLSLTITNDAGCDSTRTMVVLVRDVVNPVITCPGDTTLFADPDEQYATLSLDPPVYSDNCAPADSIAITYSLTGATTGNGSGILPDPFQFNIGITQVTYTATDDCGNEQSCVFEVEVLPIAPEIACPNDTLVYTDNGVCTSDLDPGVPQILSGTLPLDYMWIMSGATVDTGYSSPIVPSPYPFNLGLTTITWIVSNASGADTCIQTVTVVDNEPPTFTAPEPPNFCVLNIYNATYDGQPEPFADILPARPDWYILDGTTELDLSDLDDNCCPADSLNILWTITFSNGHPPLSGTGQPSQYGPIILWGNPDSYAVHTITYRLTDCNGASSEPVDVTITITPRPNVIKLY